MSEMHKPDYDKFSKVELKSSRLTIRHPAFGIHLDIVEPECRPNTFLAANTCHPPGARC
jgi:hypothetical protein